MQATTSAPAQGPAAPLSRPNLHLALLCSATGVDVAVAARILKHTLSLAQASKHTAPELGRADRISATATQTSSAPATAQDNQSLTDGNAPPAGRHTLEAVKAFVGRLVRAKALQDGSLSLAELLAEEAEVSQGATNDAEAAAAVAHAPDEASRGAVKKQGSGGSGGGGPAAAANRTNAAKKRGDSATRAKAVGGKKSAGSARTPSTSAVGRDDLAGGVSGAADAQAQQLSDEERQAAALLQERLPDCEAAFVPTTHPSGGNAPIVFLYHLRDEERLIESAVASAAAGGPGMADGIDWEEVIWGTIQPALASAAAGGTNGTTYLTDAVVVWAVAHPLLLSACKAKTEDKRWGGPAAPASAAAAVAAAPSPTPTQPPLSRKKSSNNKSVAASASPSKRAGDSNATAPSATAATAPQEEAGQGRGGQPWKRLLHPRVILFLNDKGPTEVTPAAENGLSSHFFVRGAAALAGAGPGTSGGGAHPTSSARGRSAGHGPATSGKGGHGAGGGSNSVMGRRTDGGGSGAKGGGGAGVDPATDALLELENAASEFIFFHHRHPPQHVDHVLYTCDSFHDFVDKERRFGLQKRYVQQQREVVFPVTAAARRAQEGIEAALRLHEGGRRASSGGGTEGPRGDHQSRTTRELLESGTPLEQWMVAGMQGPPTLRDFGTFLVERQLYLETVAAEEKQEAMLLLQQQQRSQGRQSMAGAGPATSKRNGAGAAAARSNALPAPASIESAANLNEKDEEQSPPQRHLSAVDCLAKIMAEGARAFKRDDTVCGEAHAVSETMGNSSHPEPVWLIERVKTATTSVSDDPATWVAACEGTLAPLLASLARLVGGYSTWCGSRAVSALPATSGNAEEEEWDLLADEMNEPSTLSLSSAQHVQDSRCVSAATLRRCAYPQSQSQSQSRQQPRSGARRAAPLESAAVYQRDKTLDGKFTVLSAAHALIAQVTLNMARKEPLRLVKPVDQSAPLASLTLTAAKAGRTARRPIFRSYATAAAPPPAAAAADGAEPKQPCLRGDAAGTSSVLLSDVRSRTRKALAAGATAAATGTNPAAAEGGSRPHSTAAASPQRSSSRAGRRAPSNAAKRVSVAAAAYTATSPAAVGGAGAETVAEAGKAHEMRFALPTDHTHDRARPLPFPQEIHWLVQQYVKKGLGSFVPTASSAAAATALRKMSELQGQQRGGAALAEAIEEEQERLVQRVFDGMAVDVGHLVLPPAQPPGAGPPLRDTASSPPHGRRTVVKTADLLEQHATHFSPFPVPGGDATTGELQRLISRNLTGREKEHILQQILLSIVAVTGGVLGAHAGQHRDEGDGTTTTTTPAPALETTVEERISLVTAASRIAAFRQRFGFHNTRVLALSTRDVATDSLDGPLTDGQSEPTSYFSNTAENIYSPRRAKQVWVCGLSCRGASGDATPPRVRGQLWVYPWRGMLSLEQHAACTAWLRKSADATAAGARGESNRGAAADLTTLSDALQRELLEVLLATPTVTLPTHRHSNVPSSLPSSPSRPYQAALHALSLDAEGKRAFFPFTNAVVELTSTKETRTCRYIHESDVAASLHYYLSEPARTRSAAAGNRGDGEKTDAGKASHARAAKYLTLRYDDGVTFTVNVVAMPVPAARGATTKAAVGLRGSALAPASHSDSDAQARRESQLAFTASPSAADGMPMILALDDKATHPTTHSATSLIPTKPPTNRNIQSGNETVSAAAVPGTASRSAAAMAAAGKGRGRSGVAGGQNTSAAGELLASVHQRSNQHDGVAPTAHAAATKEEELSRELLAGLPVRQAEAPLSRRGDVRLWVANSGADGVGDESAVAHTTRFNVTVTTNHFVLHCDDTLCGNGAGAGGRSGSPVRTASPTLGLPASEREGPWRAKQTGPPQHPQDAVAALTMTYFGCDAEEESGRAGHAAAASLLPQRETLLCAHDTHHGAATLLRATREREVRRSVRAGTGDVVRHFASGNAQTLFADGAVLIRYSSSSSGVVETLVAPSGQCYVRSPAVSTEFTRLHFCFSRWERVDDAGSESYLVSREDGVCLVYYPLKDDGEGSGCVADPDAFVARWQAKTHASAAKPASSYIRVVLHGEGTTITSFPTGGNQGLLGEGSLRVLRPLIQEVEAATRAINGSLPVSESAVRWCVESPRMPRVFLFSPPTGTSGNGAQEPFHVCFGDGTALVRRPTQPRSAEPGVQWETTLERPTRTMVRLFHSQQLAMLEPADVLAQYAAAGRQRLHALAAGQGFPVFDLAHGGLRFVDHRQHVLTVSKLFACQEDVQADMSAEPVSWEALLRQLVAPDYNPHRSARRAPPQGHHSLATGGGGAAGMPPQRQSSMRWRKHAHSAERPGGVPSLVERLRVLGEAFITSHGLLRPESLRNFMRAEEAASQHGGSGVAHTFPPGRRLPLQPEGADTKSVTGLSSLPAHRLSAAPGGDDLSAIHPLYFVQLVNGEVLQFCTEGHARQAIRSVEAECAHVSALSHVSGAPGPSFLTVHSSSGAAGKHSSAEVSGVEQLFLYRVHSPAPTAISASSSHAAAAVVAPMGSALDGTAEDPCCGSDGATTLSRYARKQQLLLATMHCGTSPAALRSQSRSPGSGAKERLATASAAVPSDGATSHWLPPTVRPPPLYASSLPAVPATSGVLRMFYRLQATPPAVQGFVLAEAVAGQMRLKELCAYHTAVTTLPATAAVTAAAVPMSIRTEPVRQREQLWREARDVANASGSSLEGGAAAVTMEERATRSAAREEQQRLRQLYYAMKEQATGV